MRFAAFCNQAKRSLVTTDARVVCLDSRYVVLRTIIPQATSRSPLSLEKICEPHHQVCDVLIATAQSRFPKGVGVWSLDSAAQPRHSHWDHGDRCQKYKHVNPDYRMA